MLDIEALSKMNNEDANELLNDHIEKQVMKILEEKLALEFRDGGPWASSGIELRLATEEEDEYGRKYKQLGYGVSDYDINKVARA